MNHFVCALLLLGLSSALANPLTGRIVGGEDAKKGEFPHQVSMRYFGNHHCGGSIYNRNTIITAAHCVVGVLDLYVTIGVGSSSWLKPNQTRSVKNFIFHEEYDPYSIDYDVAILFLDAELEYNELVQPIQLVTERPADGETVRVTGWGTLAENSAPSVMLQVVGVNVVSNDKCNQAYPGMVTDRMICAGVDGGGRDSCQGDSGGPLVNGQGQLVGIVSWGNGCGRDGFPGIYTLVPKLRSWIEQTAGLGIL